MGAAANEHSGAVKKAYCSTAAQIVKHATEARAAQLAGKVSPLSLTCQRLRVSVCKHLFFSEVASSKADVH